MQSDQGLVDLISCQSSQRLRGRRGFHTLALYKATTVGNQSVISMHFSNYTEELLLPQNQSDFITESLQMTNMKRSLSDSEDDDCFDDMKG